MLRQRSHIVRAALMAADAASMAAAFVAAYYLAGPLMTRWFGSLVVLPIYRYLWVLAAAVPAGWIILGSLGAYDLARFEGGRIGWAKLGQALVVHGAVIAAMVFFLKETEFARRVIGLFILLDLPAVAAFRPAALRLAKALLRRGERDRRVLLVGGGPEADRFLDWAARSGWGIRVAGALAGPGGEAPQGVQVLAPPERLGEVLDAQVVDDVVVSASASGALDLGEVVRKCEEVGCVVHVQTRFFQAEISQPYLDRFGEMAFLTFSATPYAPFALAAKRAMDIAGAAALLLAGWPLFVALPVLIRCTSKGAAVFRQARVGLNGRHFTMYKFRTMVSEAEQQREALEPWNETDGPAFKMERDPRVTPLGRILRRYSLDELPQAWNVLKGDMSLVGPRPPLVREAARYERWQRRRLSMRPGMTGLHQIRGRHRMNFAEWMRCDLEYIDTWSLRLDLKILLKTVPAILRGEGV